MIIFNNSMAHKFGNLHENSENYHSMRESSAENTCGSPPPPPPPHTFDPFTQLSTEPIHRRACEELNENEQYHFHIQFQLLSRRRCCVDCGWGGVKIGEIILCAYLVSDNVEERHGMQENELFWLLQSRNDADDEDFGISIEARFYCADISIDGEIAFDKDRWPFGLLHLVTGT